MDHVRQILLIGLRGSGKSTIGARAAARVARPFIDLDDLALQRAGRDTIEEVWRIDGEEAFRRAEVEALRSVLARTDAPIVALGGGAPETGGVSDLIRRARRDGRAWVVYLRALPADLRARLEDEGGADARRPSLTGADPLDEIPEVFARRDLLYRTIVDLVLEVGGKGIAEVERLLLERIEGRGGEGAADQAARR